METKKKYTIVPFSEYEDKSGLSEDSIRDLFLSIKLLNERGMFVSVPVGEVVGEKGISLVEICAFSLFYRPQIIRKENGDLALLVFCTKKLPSKKRTYFKEIRDFEQRYFPEFFMPVLKCFNNYFLEGELRNFFQKLQFKDKDFFKLLQKFKDFVRKKKIAIQKQEYEEASHLRDGERQSYEELRKYLQPKVEKFIGKIRGFVLTEDWMEYLRD